METLAFGALVGNDVVVLGRPKLALEATGRRAVGKHLVAEFPFGGSFIDSGVWALGFASAAIDTVGGDVNGHGFRRDEVQKYRDFAERMALWKRSL